VKPLLASCVALFAFTTSAQGLNDFLAAAEKGNVDQHISVEQRNRAAAEYRQTWTALFPSLSASASWTHNQYNAEIVTNPVTMQKLVIVPYDQLDGVLRFDLPLINPQLWMRIGATGASEEAAALREQVVRDAIRKQIIGSYYGYAAALEVRTSAKKSLGVAEAQLKLTEIRNGAGTATELDLARSKAEVARNRQTIADTESLVATTRRVLRTLSGLEPPESVALPVDDVTPMDPLEQYEARIDALPALKAAEKDREAAGRISTAAKLALIPTVGAQYTQRFTNATGFQGQAATFNTGINLSWRLDVPTVMGIQTQATGEQLAVLAGDRARLQARDQVNSDWQRLKAALTKIEAAKAQVEAASKAAQVAKDRYAAGVATQVDVIQAERDLFGAEVSQIQARTELATARLSLKISAAMPLE
jgi:outer membrane protein TolC